MMTAEENNLRSPTAWIPADPVVDPARQEKLLRVVLTELVRLERSPFYRRFLLRLRSPEVQNRLADALSSECSSSASSSSSRFDMVVYGIGSFESSRAAQFQLALALLLNLELEPAMSGSLQLFDPVLSATECAVARELGFKVADVNEHGRKEVMAPTLFFMPHCDLELYDALLQTNWQPSARRRMVILGNSFTDYKEDAVRGCHGIRSLGRHVLLSREIGSVTELDMAVDLSPGEEKDYLHRLLEMAFRLISWHFFHS